jgi:hypothetical protein
MQETHSPLTPLAHLSSNQEGQGSGMHRILRCVASCRVTLCCIVVRCIVLCRSTFCCVELRDLLHHRESLLCTRVFVAVALAHANYKRECRSCTPSHRAVIRLCVSSYRLQTKTWLCVRGDSCVRVSMRTCVCMYRQ